MREREQEELHQFSSCGRSPLWGQEVRNFLQASLTRHPGGFGGPSFRHMEQGGHLGGGREV